MTGGDIALLQYLMRNKHTSPFEFVQFQFLVKCPILTARQWMRHRAWSYNEWSGRYTELPDEYYLPSVTRLRTQSTTNKQGSSADQVIAADLINQRMEDEQRMVFDNYKTYLETDVAKEIARVNVPVSTYTQFRASVDLHNLLHFLKLRCDPHAQEEIRVYANAIVELIRPIVPMTISAWETYSLNAVTLSSLELELVIKALGATEEGNHILVTEAKSALSPREYSEFLTKLKLQ